MRTLALSLCLLLGGVARAADRDFFNAEVRPILAQHCFKCHGPDEKTRKAKLRLDLREEALKPGRSGSPALVPGKPEQSELIKRILSSDETEVMPPPSTKSPLSSAQKEILKRWVRDGAEYHPHWAFVAPKQAPLPAVKNSKWPRKAIDSFILARLEAEGLQPSAQADRYTLIRRLSFDLIGLPPTPEEVDAFINDKAPDAYEKVVDRLLASPRYGERWARRWLDLARYADTNGYEKDRPRSIWPYRDWVINALNADMPFDQFTIEQIAGDLLPNATQQQRIATGFHRNTMTNEEGGIDPLEFRFYSMTDRVGTTGTVWLGMTLVCAQCHSHKYDPIAQKEYYQLMAFLNNADEPEMEVVQPELARKRHELEQKIDDLLQHIPTRYPVKAAQAKETLGAQAHRQAFETAMAKWYTEKAKNLAQWTPLTPIEAKANVPLLTVLPDRSIFASGDQTKSDTYTLTFNNDLQGITALRVEALPDPRLPKGGPGRVYYEGPPGDFTLCDFRLEVGGKKVKLAKASHSFASGGFTADKAIDDNLQTGWSINGGQGRAHNIVFNLAEPLRAGGTFTIKMLFARHYSAGLGRFRVSVTTQQKEAVAVDLPSEIETLLHLPPGERSPEQKRLLERHFILNAPEMAALRKEIETLRRQMPAYPTTLVMQERPPENPRQTFVHRRGEFLQPTERVEPGVPAFLPPLPDGAPRNRLTLARWLVAKDNPLVGRVTMNRQWAAFFGRGIVRTTQDFGFQGEAPSHPELLDWLAVELVRQGWSMKKMHKLIVMSATYQQVSRVTPEVLKKDPENKLLGRGPRVRLEAEMIRDAALSVSGLLSPKMGGPSVFPPQPPGVTTEGAYGRLDWKVSQGEDRYRRGLYTFMKRTAPYAMFATFDGPSGEVCLARREITNTPLQALTMLNDVALVEAAQALGRLTAKQATPVEKRVDELFRRVLTRPPSAEERTLLVQFYQKQKARLERKELDASALAGPGEGDVNERAAWTALARVLFNLDEAIIKG